MAVAAVLLFHGNRPGVSSLTDNGYLGVMIFYCISGFLITARLQSELEANGRIDFWAFYLRRFFRIIAPAYLFLSVLVLLNSIGAVPVLPGEMIASLFFVRNIVGGGHAEAWYTGHLWSLAVEEQFYLTWPWVMLAGPRRARWTALALALGVHGWRMFTSYTQLPLPDGLAQPWYDYMMWGCWWALVLRAPARKAAVQKLLTVPVWFMTLLLFFVLVAAGPGRFVFQIGFLISVILVGTVINPNSTPSRMLETRPLRWLGQISYGLYLWQQLFFVAIRDQSRSTVETFPWNLIALLAIVVPIYYWFERPLIALGYRLTTTDKDPPRHSGRG